MQGRHIKSLVLWVLVIVIFLLLFSFFTQEDSSNNGEAYTYADMIRYLEAGRITNIVIQPFSEQSSSATAEITLYSGNTQTVFVPSLDSFLDFVHNSLDVYPRPQVETLPPRTPSLLITLLPFIVMGVIFIIVILFISSQNQNASQKAMSFGKHRARIASNDTRRITFDQVAGLDEEKEDLAEVVDFMRDATKYIRIGARIPRGILLVGPPGTGKTHLARAVAGEAKVPFYSISGSDFVEMFVGVGASRVRDLFAQAKANAPSIVMIDEIDAVGRRRGTGVGGGHDEREQTLNQLLVEMDGFSTTQGIIVIAATNRPDILDPALLRPGRFDRRIVVNRPDVKGREAVLEVHAVGKEIASDVSLKVVAQTTAGFTPAELENLLNEAALLAARYNKPAIDMESIRQAFIKVGIGSEKRSRAIQPDELRKVAYHEAGHAICFEMLPELSPTHIVSIIATGNAAGYVMSLPSVERTNVGKQYLLQNIIATLGGRAAEEIIYSDTTTGASQDIAQVSKIAREMVMKYGMSEKLGPIKFGNESDEVFLGRDMQNSRNYSDDVAAAIDEEVKNIVENAYASALSLLNENIETLHKIVDVLLEKERITGSELRAIFPPGVLPVKD